MSGINRINNYPTIHQLCDPETASCIERMHHGKDSNSCLPSRHQLSNMQKTMVFQNNFSTGPQHLAPSHE